jgi:hypothetical protein
MLSVVANLALSAIGEGARPRALRRRSKPRGTLESLGCQTRRAPGKTDRGDAIPPVWAPGERQFTYLRFTAGLAARAGCTGHASDCRRHHRRHL